MGGGMLLAIRGGVLTAKGVLLHFLLKILLSEKIPRSANSYTNILNKNAVFGT